MRPPVVSNLMRILVALVGLLLVGLGFWAFFDPASFFDRVALFPPYNQHFLHDVGAFQVGLGVALWLALVWGDALLVVLVAVATAATIHEISHIIDRDLGGHPVTDLPGLGLLALLLIVLAVLRLRQLRTTGGA